MNYVHPGFQRVQSAVPKTVYIVILYLLIHMYVYVHTHMRKVYLSLTDR